MCSLEPKSKSFFVIVKPEFQVENKAYVIDIPMERLEVFKKTNPKDYDVYIPHDHDYGDQCRFRRLTNVSHLGSYSVTPNTKLAIIDKTMYGFGDEGVFMSLNLANSENWENGPPTISGRWYPELISLHNKLYIFGGFVIRNEDKLPFGEIYDPQNKKWSVLEAPEASPIISATDNLFVASLGESEGKLMVYCTRYDSIVYIYDTNSEVWETRSSSVLYTTLFYKDIFKPEFINEDDNNLYWIEKETASIIAFDWKKNQIYSGPVIGLESLDSPVGLAFTSSVTSLHHLSADLFCLIWFTPDHSAKTNDLHVTILRVIKHTSESFYLDAMVVGCFHDTIDGYCINTSALPPCLIV